MTEKPLILVTNDDGIYAPGLRSLVDTLRPHYRLVVVAPLEQQSGVGMGCTVHRPLHLKSYDWGDDIKVWSVTGTPADCVKMALSVLLEEKPSMVCSGINAGSNMGRNVLYSGTVGGAAEATLRGIPSIAFSCQEIVSTNYNIAVKHLLTVVEWLKATPLPEGTLLNVNFPRADEIRGFRLARQGKGYYTENPHERAHPVSGGQYWWLGGVVSVFDETDDSDVALLKQGYATVVPIHISDLTDQAFFAKYNADFMKLIER